jgi:hypothetical protein
LRLTTIEQKVDANTTALAEHATGEDGMHKRDKKLWTIVIGILGIMIGYMVGYLTVSHPDFPSWVVNHWKGGKISGP